MKIVLAVLPHLIIGAALLGLVFQIFWFGETRRALGMAAVTDWLWRVARYLYGGYFVYTAVMIGHTLWIGGEASNNRRLRPKRFTKPCTPPAFFTH
jgi:uncharacterized membrane protein YkvI